MCLRVVGAKKRQTLTLNDQFDDGLRLGTVVDEATVLAAVLGKHGMKVERKRVRQQINPMSMLPNGGRFAHVLDQLRVWGPLQSRNKGSFGNTGALKRDVAMSFRCDH